MRVNDSAAATFLIALILTGCSPAPTRVTIQPSQTPFRQQETARTPTAALTPGRQTQPAAQVSSLIYFTGDNGCEIRRVDVVEGKNFPVGSVPPGLCIEDKDHWVSKRWSPDGSQFAVALMDATQGRAPLEFSIHIVRFNGSGEYTLISGSGGITPQGLSWSPDGKRLAYVITAETESGGEIFVLRVVEVDVQGHKESGYIQLTDETISLNPIPGGEIDWSPDGKWIAFTAQDAAQRAGIYLANSMENDFRLLAGDLPMRSVPDWSPDGARIAYADGGIWKAMDTDGVGRTVVSAESGMDINCVAWSEDGAELFCLVQSGPTARRLAAYRVDGGGMRILTDDSPLFIRDMSNAQWSPDGAVLALRDFENFQLFIYSPERAVLQNLGVETGGDFAWFAAP